jgi:hypothetical protein
LLPKEESVEVTNYKKDLVGRYWAYLEKTSFPREYFDRYALPVFYKDKESHNVIVRPGTTIEENTRLFNILPEGERHKWFRSMNSSQALAQSVLGNLAVNNQLNCLADLANDSKESFWGEAQVSFDEFVMEHKVTYLREIPPHLTSLDGFIPGEYQIAIECKFTEVEVGTCSHPGLTPAKAGFCDGNFTQQKGRRERCALTEKEVLYWKYIPELFDWRNDADLEPCPLYKNYQLVRNVLAACVQPDGNVSPANGHVVLVYDERNPAFQEGGKGFNAFMDTRKALKVPSLLRKHSWQHIIRHLSITTRLRMTTRL